MTMILSLKWMSSWSNQRQAPMTLSERTRRRSSNQRTLSHLETTKRAIVATAGIHSSTCNSKCSRRWKTTMMRIMKQGTYSPSMISFTKGCSVPFMTTSRISSTCLSARFTRSRAISTPTWPSCLDLPLRQLIRKSRRSISKIIKKALMSTKISQSAKKHSNTS